MSPSLPVVALAFAALAAMGSRDARACEPAVTLAGDPDLMMRLSTLLAHDGVLTRATDAADGCPIVRVRVAEDATGIDVAITDAEGRTISRHVSDVATAAAVVESWARPDAADPLLTPREDPPARALPRAAPPVAAATIVQVTNVSRRPRGVIGVSGDTVRADDDSTWLGVSAFGCVRLGPSCIGARGHFDTDTHLSGASRDVGSKRADMAVLLDLELPVRVWRLTITPGVGAGLGWTHTGLASAPAAMRDVDIGGLRASAHVGVALPLRRNLELDLTLSFDVAPFSHDNVTQTTVSEELMSGEPDEFTRLGVGLRLVN